MNQPNSLQELPFDDNSFDFVRCNNVAHGIPENQVGCLAERGWQRLTHPNQVAIFMSSTYLPSFVRNWLSF
jgi:ubiquinone/menaquinone biosynthesis C-methylase UbiE